ncbi:hypothetical protein ABT340_31530 [Streptosporangium sp. NPDC000239]|uniref:hypothetical protein n=1 Tax=Streptosporangium sp. NPDC000239 TaxID=3154248 RepID=UPI00332CC65E
MKHRSPPLLSLVAVVVSVVLVFTGIAVPAQALSTCEGANRAAARLAAVRGGAIRLMCAGAAPAHLAALAANADDVVMSFEVPQVDRGPLQAEVDKIHRTQEAGRSPLSAPSPPGSARVP